MLGGFDYLFFIEVLTGGLLSGVMYSLVAIGFVLIYKTSGVLNFAQGSQLLFAALTFVSLVERGAPFAAAFLVSLAVMVALGLAIERAVLRPLVNKPPITLFMATLGLSYVIEGAAQLLWGTQGLAQQVRSLRGSWAATTFLKRRIVRMWANTLSQNGYRSK